MLVYCRDMSKLEEDLRSRRRERRAGEHSRRTFGKWLLAGGVGLSAATLGGYKLLTRKVDGGSGVAEDGDLSEEFGGITETLGTGLELRFGSEFLEQIEGMEGGLEIVIRAMEDYTAKYGFSDDLDRINFLTEDLSGRGRPLVGDIADVVFESARPGKMSLDLGLLIDGSYIFDGKQVETLEERRGAIRSVVLHAATHALRTKERSKIDPGIVFNEDQTLVGVEGFAMVIREDGVDTGFTMIEEGFAEALRFEMGDNLKMSVLYEEWGRMTQSYMRDSGVSVEEAARLNQKNDMLGFTRRLYGNEGDAEIGEIVYSMGFIYLNVADNLSLGFGGE